MATTTVVVQQPQGHQGQLTAVTTTTNRNNNGSGNGAWQHSIFGCFDNCYVCCCSYFCPCYVVGKVAESVGASCCCHSLIFCLFTPLSLCCQCSIRGRVRQQHGIEGSLCGDVCCTLFCTFCALAQEAMEMNAL
jgi:Cys-rich protein (TIGR01571 family)